MVVTRPPRHRVAVVTTARDRRDHLDRQRASVQLAAPGVRHVIVDMGGDPIEAGQTEIIVAHEVADGAALPLSAARNAGAACADAEVLVFLDVDCLATDDLVAQYVRNVGRYGGIWSGPVGYLPPASEISDHSDDTLMTIARFHDGRPRPGQRPTLAPSPDMFWSLSFALDRATWERIGGFDEDFLGYGGEDTDFARTAHRLGVASWFDGHGVSFHQHHPVSSPPVEHLDDIVANSRVFHDKWGDWPMTGWLGEFSQLGLIDWHLDGSEIIRRDPPVSPASIPQQETGHGIIGFVDMAPVDDDERPAAGPLGRLVGDLGEFESGHWGRRPLIRSTGEDFDDVWSIAALDDFMANGIRSPLIRLVRDGSPIPVGEYTGPARLGGRDVTDAIRPERVAELFAGGATVVAQSLHRTESGVRGFLRALSAEVSHPVQANSYLTPPGSVGLAPHADNHDVFVVQVQGSKQWTVDGIGDFVVTPGDTVYIPAGTRHSAESTDVASLHLTIGVMRVTYRQVLNRLLRGGPSRLDDPLPLRYRSPDALLRTSALDTDATPAPDLAADIGSMISDVARWLDDVDVNAVADVERGRSAQSIPDGGAIGAVVALQHLDQTSLIARCAEPWMISRSPSGRVEIRTSNHVLDAPESCRPCVEQVAQGDTVSVGRLDGLDAASRLIIARRLISAGLCVQLGV